MSTEVYKGFTLNVPGSSSPPPWGVVENSLFKSLIDDLELKGDVFAAAIIPDNVLVRGDGGAKGIQGSGITVDDSNNLSGVNALSASSATITADLKVNDLTANKPAWTNGNKELISKDVTACDIIRTKLTPTAQTVNTGTLSSGTVSDVQTWEDGNEVHISEVAGVPGFDIVYTIPNVADFCEIGVAFYYVGSITHECKIQIYDDTNAVWKNLISQAGAGLSHNYRFIEFPDPANISDYINSSDEVKIRFYHSQNGNVSHDLYIDYVSITGSTT